jgi:hypothetical protein
MFRLVTSCAVVAGLLWVGGVQASPKGSPKGNHGNHKAGHAHGGKLHHTPPGRLHEVRRVGQGRGLYRDWHLTHGVKFSGGYLYGGKRQPHWAFRYWNPRLRCWSYWDPGTLRFYYWCAPDACYYPMTTCPSGRFDYDDDGDPSVPRGNGPSPVTNEQQVNVNVAE